MFELRLGKLGLILFISGMSLLLFSMFLMGVVVGKHLEAYPERYAQGIPELIGERLFSSSKAEKTMKPMADASDKNTSASAAAEEDNFGLTFYDTLGGKKGAMAGIGEVGSIKTGASGNPPQAVASTVVPAATAERASPQVSKGETVPKKGSLSADVPGDKADVQKASPPSGASVASPPKATVPSKKGQFEVQAAAYQEMKRAEQMARKFASMGFAPRVVVKELPGKGTWYRVIVDGFENRETAQAAADKMAEKVHGLRCVIRSSGKNP